MRLLAIGRVDKEGQGEMKKHVWIIEMLCDGKWEPTIGCRLTRSEAREEMKCDWMARNKHDRFRVRKYVAEDIKRKEK